MKKIYLMFVLFLVSFAIAKVPELNVFTDRGLYQSGESGTIFVELKTFGLISNAEMEVVVLSPENAIVDGAILQTEIPEKTSISKGMQTEQILVEEGFGYLQEEKSITRTVNFKIPYNVPIGDYKVNARVVSGDILLEKSTTISVLGAGAADAIILIYTMIIILILGIKYYA
ncbi:MAG: hypothetical protein V1900_03360 [Candidatus Aenigmatarchaeota archaeon]